MRSGTTSARPVGRSSLSRTSRQRAPARMETAAGEVPELRTCPGVARAPLIVSVPDGPPVWYGPDLCRVRIRSRGSGRRVKASDNDGRRLNGEHPPCRKYSALCANTRPQVEQLHRQS